MVEPRIGQTNLLKAFSYYSYELSPHLSGEENAEHAQQPLLIAIDAFEA